MYAFNLECFIVHFRFLHHLACVFTWHFSMRIREHGCQCSEMAVLVQHGVNLMTVKVGDGEKTGQTILYI